RTQAGSVHWKTGGAAGPVAGGAGATTGAGMGEALTTGAGIAGGKTTWAATGTGAAMSSTRVSREAGRTSLGSNDNGRDVRAAVGASSELASEQGQGRATEP